ncbi:MAG: 50S ribosome-binding GTPase [Phycisphaeraceae bacterium]|nr:50S ribosome-binding GTPase [Phycisphaeraceae bacterium]
MSAGEGGIARWSLDTPWPARGAIAVLRVSGEEAAVDAVAAAIGAAGHVPAGMMLRTLAGTDRALACRFDGRTLLLFPHAGRAIIESLVGAIERAGAQREDGPDARSAFPEARDQVEARALLALAGAASPLAADVLLAQRERWSRIGELGEVDLETAGALARLLRPPLVAAVGPPNVGKSSLLNALAGRSVSIVADEPGTTRDHVGAMIDLGGLVVRWIDCPGFDPREGDTLTLEAQHAAAKIAGTADLVIGCGDAASGFLETMRADALRVGLRADLGRDGDAAAWVSTRTGEGMHELVTLVRERLVPAAALADPRAWRFWDVGTQPGG